MLLETILRFLFGGIIVTIFAVIGDIFRPRTFSGLFGAAPTVALATLGLTFAKEGVQYVSTEGRSMIAGAVGLFTYSLVTSLLLKKRNWHGLIAAALAYVFWFGVAFLLWALFLR